MITKYNKLSFIFCLLIASSIRLFAQDKHIITSGVIEFEKTDNMFALIKSKITKNSLEYKPFYEQYLRTEPQFIKLNSSLSFNNNASLYIPAQKVKYLDWHYDSPMVNQLNTVYSDFITGRSTIQKEFFERTFLVNDSLRKIKWKITDETRIIAGYKCRRANGLMLDSIYVVAFYTDRIHISGGPESLNGLPGMILGASIPHEHVTWFATKVTEISVDSKSLTRPNKGEPVNNQQLKNEIMKAIDKNGDLTIFLLKGLLL